jgi:ATP-dependent DNA helicase RecQ
VGFGFENIYDFDLNAFCFTFKFPLLPTFNALKILEQAGYIEYIEDPGNRSRLMFTVLRDDLYKLKQQDPKTEELINIVLRSYTGLFSDYAFINEKLLAVRCNMSGKEVYDRLVQLSKQRIISYIPQKKMPIIVYLQSREDLQYLTIPKMIFEERKARSEKRIGAMLDYVENDTICRSKMLLAYFGETDTEACGICDVCLSEKDKNVDTDEFKQLESLILKILAKRAMPLKQLTDSVSFPPPKVLKVIRFLIDEGVLINDNNTISVKK